MPRNPFGVPDVIDPTGDDVLAFAAQRLPALRGGTQPPSPELAGFWSGRWDRERRDRSREHWRRGEATIVEQDARLYVLYRDVSDYLIESVHSGGACVGRYQNLCVAGDSTPWIGVIANEHRIYGLWERGAWDFFRLVTR